MNKSLVKTGNSLNVHQQKSMQNQLYIFIMVWIISNYKEWLLLYSTKWINLKNIALTEKKPDTWKYIAHDSIFMIAKNCQNQSMGNRNQKENVPGGGGRGCGGEENWW